MFLFKTSISNCQQHTRPCARLDYEYVVEPLSQFYTVPVIIHVSTYEKVVLSFPRHREALQVKNLGGTNLCIKGSPYRVFYVDVPVHLRTVTSDQSASDHYPEEPASRYVNN